MTNTLSPGWLDGLDLDKDWIPRPRTTDGWYLSRQPGKAYRGEDGKVIVFETREQALACAWKLKREVEKGREEDEQTI